MIFSEDESNGLELKIIAALEKEIESLQRQMKLVTERVEEARKRAAPQSQSSDALEEPRTEEDYKFIRLPDS
jgi:uncharacterized coiled-coil protein SlyX